MLGYEDVTIVYLIYLCYFLAMAKAKSENFWQNLMKVKFTQFESKKSVGHLELHLLK